MLEFIIGAGVAASLFGGMMLGASKIEKGDKPKSKNPYLKEIFGFFEDVKKGKVVNKQDNWSGWCIQNDNVSVYLFDHGNEIKHLIIYVKTKRIFDITYDLSKEAFIKFADEHNVLEEDETELFVRYFHSFIRTCYKKISHQDLVSLLNDTIEKKEKEQMEEKPKEWTDYLPQIQQVQIIAILTELKTMLHALRPDKERFDTEEKHRLERLENEILPELLAAFCAFETAEQAKAEHVLLQTLLGAKESVLELQQKKTNEKSFVFRKNIELLKYL